MMKSELSFKKAFVLSLLLGLFSSQVLAQADPRSAPPDNMADRTPLTVEERVACQRAIEEVYWRHRIWPTENPQPKPALDDAIPASLLRAKVEDDLRKSEALRVYWQRSITGEQLQAEMNRMTRQTKQPGMLRELWTALGNDPYLIAECLARPALANRLIQNWYSWDERFHGSIRHRAEKEIEQHKKLREMSGQYHEAEWMKRESSALNAPGSKSVPANFSPSVQNMEATMLTSEEWNARMAELVQAFNKWKKVSGSLAPADLGVNTDLDGLPQGEVSRLQEEAGGFHVFQVQDKGAGYVKVATVEWMKEPFDAWWKRGQDMVPLQMPEAGYVYSLPGPDVGSGPCKDDTWEPTLAPVISARSAHTAVWTGSEMIVWGGSERVDWTNTGGRYNPATDTWIATSRTDAPSPRYAHTAVWTGREMIVWGGAYRLDTGGRYNPATDTWAATSPVGAPTGRFDHTAIWTGTEMIVWGGTDGGGGLLSTGGRYDPAMDSWGPTSLSNAPSPRIRHKAVWTGSEMIVWGGCSGGTTCAGLLTGGRYDPVTDSWAPTSVDGAPVERLDHTAVWTGDEMIVWGGCPTRNRFGCLSYRNTGGRYNPVSDSWAATSTTRAPSARAFHTVVWTGSEMIIWGGLDGYFLSNGGRYDPMTDGWDNTSTTNAPPARAGHTAVWAVHEMIVWGGDGPDGEDGFRNRSGGRYDPATDSWVAVTPYYPPGPRFGHTAIWSGSEMIIWGGSGPSGFLRDLLSNGGRYDPATDSWMRTSTNGAPSPRDSHTAIWTGDEMIVWGGFPDLNTGGRYNPATDRWMPTSTTGAPAPRRAHTAVWTGREMIVWGGNYSPPVNTGGRYDPATDNWVATSTIDAPSQRVQHTAVWTDREMIIWGGYGGFPDIQLNTGARYNPTTNTWAATSLTDAPSPRRGHTAVWTSREMIVWGGGFGSEPMRALNTGGRYNPVTGGWRATSTADAPHERYWHPVVWTGSEMIIWGGGDPAADTGGRYNPATDNWRATSTINAPSRRTNHTAVWTGSETIIWGGYVDTGGRYCASGITSAENRSD